MKEAANRGKGKTILISAGMEIMLIICITAANLNPTPILYFIFYNLLYGLVFSLLIPLYCISGNNLIVSFFVNLPNAFVTYILKYEQFPVMRVSSTIAAAVTLVLIGLILLVCRNVHQRISPAKKCQ